MDDHVRKFAFAGAALAVILAVGVALYVLQPTDDSTETPPDEEPAQQSLLEAWSTKDAQEVQVTWSDSGAPTVALPGSALELGSPDYTWSTEPRGTSTILEGRREAAADISWEFTPGNPTAVFEARHTLTPDDLANPVTVELTLPSGELEAWNAKSGFHAVDAYESRSGAGTWLRWRSGEAVLTFRGWSGDRFTVTPLESGGYAVELTLWSPKAHPHIVECIGEMDVGEIRLQGRSLVEFRELPKLTAWPYPDAAEAMLLPIFVAPELHSDPQLGEARSRNAEDFASRVTTLAYGHSSPKDPRYGNGGLLGHGLGGTVVAPEKLLDSKKVASLAEDLAPTRVGIAAGGSSPADAPYDIRYASEASCETLGSPRWLGLISAATGEGVQPVREAPAPFPIQIAARVLDGRLDSLLAQGFSRAYVDQALRNRDIYAFASPLVATRNPLIGAAADALLEPERNGMWTVSPRLAGGLADVELWREEHPIGVSSVDNLVSYRAFSREAALTWTETGAPHVSAASAQSQIGYTIALEGDAALPDTLSPPPSVRVVETENGPVTLLSWDAAPDTSSLQLQRDLGQAAIDWNIAQK
ncbi:MAG: hypothetical protein ACQEVA_16860 [Myxococcota bacterium]